MRYNKKCSFEKSSMNIDKLKDYVIGRISKEISPRQTYHGPHHTLEVLENCEAYIDRLNIEEHDAYLLRTAALLHDIGFIDEFKGHEMNGIRFAKEHLPEWGYKKDEIEHICGMIAATELPQNPKNLLEQILCDSDLDYLGTDRFYEVGATLFEEFMNYGVVSSEEEWDNLQVRFLQNHHYHTEFAKKHRAPKKQEHLNQLKNKLNL